MAKTAKDPLKKISALMDKAKSRGEKLERTLIKLVAQMEPGSAIEDFLKSVQGGLKAVGKSAKSVERSSTNRQKAEKPKAAKKAKPSKDADEKSAKKPVRSKASPKEPASADIRPVQVTNSPE